MSMQALIKQNSRTYVYRTTNIWPKTDLKSAAVTSSHKCQVQAHKNLNILAMQVCCPNGMDWDQDKGLFYFIDTADSVVRSYPVDENGVPKRSQDGVLLGVKDVRLKLTLCLDERCLLPTHV